jgi:hypothetical protein
LPSARGFRITPSERAAKRGPTSKVNVRRMQRGLARVEVDMQKLKMCAQRSSDCQCRFDDNAIGLATACGDKDRLHVAGL